MPLIEVNDLRKSYGDRTVLDGVSFTVEEGEIFGILGHNGAGKTTTVETVAGLRTPDEGSVRVFGADPARDRARITQSVGVQLQQATLPDRLRVGEAMELFASFYSQPRDTGELLEVLGLAEHRDRPVKVLSGGLKQRLSMALALVGSPKIAVLDELTTGLDPQARRDVWQLVSDIRESGVTVLLVTHFMEEAERLSDRAAIFDHGRIIALDTPEGLVRRVSTSQSLRFRPDRPFDDALLRGLPEVTGVEHVGDLIVVTGGEDVVRAVMTLLAREQIVTQNLRVEQASLDDAFLALTGRPLEQSQEQ